MEKARDNTPTENENDVLQPFVMLKGEGTGSLTFGQVQRPQGEVMKLQLMNVRPQENCEATRLAGSQLFGTHIKEAIAIVKDWKSRP